MAKGYDKNKERREEVALLGKALVRRAKKRCELCETQGVSMSVVEVEPAPATPDIDHAVIICDTCKALLGQDKPDANQSRFLDTAIWNEIPAVQVTAVRLCRKVAAAGAHWAQDLLDNAYLSPEAEEWLKND